MNIQTLVVTTDRADHSLPEQMNIQTAAVVGNQCGRNETEEFEFSGKIIKWISSDTRGVGINRNEVLMRASADICIFADDDMIFKDGYADKVAEWFDSIPDADILIFNLECDKKRYINTKVKKINRFNYGKYGAARMAFKRDAVMFSGVSFHTQFGGGSKYSCGEDTIFLKECIEKGLKVYAVPETIASISDDESSWFGGFNDKYFFDKGVLYYVLSKKTCSLHALYHCFRYRNKYMEYGWEKAFGKMLEGIRSVKS